MRVFPVIRSLGLTFLISVAAMAEGTLFVDCEFGGPAPVHKYSPISLSEDQTWRAYVEVSARKSDCLMTTRLWVARASEPWRLIYLIAPTQVEGANGMEILGWAPHSRMLLARARRWQWGSDAEITEHVLAIDAESGMVYEPELRDILDRRKDKECTLSVMDAGFGDSLGVNVLVRAKLGTAIDPGDTEEDIPPARRCGSSVEVWAFNPGTHGVKQATDSQPFRLFRNSIPNPFH